MASLDSLPADQRAVLELVLQRGRSYDQIAELLSVDRAGVRQRALAAFDAIGPQTQIPPERRALITDYLLGQLPPRVTQSVRERLGSTPTERAWARMLASELGPIARDPLPEIPVAPTNGGGEGIAAAAAAPVAARAAAPTEGAAAPREGAAAAGETAERPGDPGPGPGGDGGAGAPSGRGARGGAGSPLATGPRRSSRLGGGILLGLGVLAVIAVVLVIVLIGGGGSTKQTSSTAARATSTSTAPTSATSTTAAKVIGQVNLSAPAAGSQAKGIAQVIRVGKSEGVVIYATGIPANTKSNSYAVWLYNGPKDFELVGYVNPGVGSDGRLQTTGPLPGNPARFKQLLVTLQTQAQPKTPTTVVLQGPLALK